MNWLDKFERKCGRFAIPNLMRMVVIGMALVFCCDLLFPQAMLSYYLYFSPALILMDSPGLRLCLSRWRAEIQPAAARGLIESLRCHNPGGQGRPEHLLPR